ncbi:MAG: hypothetical protein K0S29_288 [Gammaproteobacteria bacterium]|nr:hypothetical protein [Gammaproteobacteria bacterium]
MKITSRCPFLIGEIDEAGQAAHSYVKDYYSPAMLAAHNKYEIAEVIDSREIANSQLKAALSELGTAFNSDNLIRNLSKFIGGREKASYTKAKQEFNKWWESKQVGQLLKIGANLHIKNENGSLYLLDYVVVYGGIDKLREIVELDAIAWADKKYATLRYLILFENKGSEAVKLLYNWGFNRGFGNIFDLTDEIGNSLLLHFCQFFQEAEVLVHSPSALNWLIELEQAGFISFKQEFGMGAQTFLSLPKEIMESLVKDRAKLIDENQFRMQALDVMPEEVRTALRDDDFSVIKPYFQEAEYKFYQIYAIFTDALVNRKWQIVEGCLSLPEFNLANSAELNKAIAQTYLSNALTVLTSKLPRVRIEDFIIDPDVLKDYKAVFKAWWQEYHIEALLKLKADPILEQKDNLELLAYVSMLGDAEHLAALNSIVELPWDSMAFALYRKIIFASKDFDKAKALYDYGVRKWSSNIFEKSDYAGRNALFSSLYTIYAGLKDDADTKKLYDERFKELEEAGIADFIKLFGGSGVKIATSGPSSIRYQLYIKIPLAFVFNNYYVGLTLVLGNIGIALSMAGYCALDRRPRVPEPVQEEPANHAPERHARRMPPAQVRPAPEDPTARQMNELQTALGQARQLLEHIQIKKADAEQKSKVQGAVPEYAQLLQAYENAIQKHQAFISALSSAIANMNSQNLASLSIAKEQLQTTSESCVQAEALVRRAEEAKIVHEREAELQARRQTAQQESLSKEQKLSEIITKLTQLQGQDIEDLIKLNQMKALLQETQVLGIEMNKLKPKLAPFIKEKERIEAHVMNLVTLLNTEAVGVLALAANYEASLATRMAEIKAWRSKIQEMGAIHPDVKSAFERSTELLLGLSGEGREYYRLLFQYSGDIEHCNKLDMPIRDKLSQVKKSYKKLQELFFQLGLNQSQVELLTEVPVNKIIEDLQKQSDIESGWENFVRLNREYANLFYTVKDLCQRIRQELNPKEMEKQISSGDVNSFLYLKRHQAMAICFNLARLFEQLGIVWPELGDIRHHLVHRYYLSKDNPNLLLDLAELFIDEDTVLKQLHLKLLTRDNSLEDQIKNTEYFKRYCTRSIRYSEELRQPQTLIDEIKDCLKVLQEFVANIDPDKGPDLSADAKGLLSDHARMAVNSLCHDLLGDYRIQLCEYFETRGMNRSGIKNMLQFMESNMVRVLRNKTMHEASVEAAGMVAVKSELDGNALKMISIELKSLRKLLENIPARESLALRTLRADAPEWRPAQTM